MSETPRLPSLNPSSFFAKGNQALREKKFTEAAAFYLKALEVTPELSQTIATNLGIVRQKRGEEAQASGRMRVAVCGWELSHNAAGRVHTLAKLYETFAEVEIIGSIFSHYGKSLWGPVRGTQIPVHSFLVEREEDFLKQALELVVAHPYDIVHLSKPRAPNLFIGALYKLLWGAQVIMDIDDEELSFIDDGEAIGIDDYFRDHGSLPPLKHLDGQDWTRLAVGLAQAFDGLTVSNPALQKKYGGEIVRHARDERLFQPSPRRKRASREALGIPQGKKVVIFLGTPRPHKGLLETAEALRSLKRGDLVFAIIGDFQDASFKQRLLEKTGVDYFFLENQPFEKVPDLLAAGDFCVLLQDPASPVARFQVPAKLSCALAMGLAVFASDVPPLSDIAALGAITPATPDSLAQALLEFIQDEERMRRASESARAVFAAEMSFAANVPRLRGALEKRAQPANAEEYLSILLANTAPAFLANLWHGLGSKPKAAIHPGHQATLEQGLHGITHDVIVCIHNAPDDVRACLDSIVKGASHINKIILVDDCSNAQTKELIEEYSSKRDNIQVIHTAEQLGYTKAANLGLKQSQADIRTLLNSDTIVASGWSRKITEKFINNPEIGIVGPLSNAASYQSVPNIAGTKGQTAVNHLPANASVFAIDKFCERAARNLDVPYVPLVHGFCFSISSACLKQIGYFDESNFPRGYGEENDFCIRAGDAGFALGLALDTYVYHAKSKSYPSQDRVALMDAGWNALVAKHGKNRLVNAIKMMENLPSLVYMRQAVQQRFYADEQTTHDQAHIATLSNDFGSSAEVKTIAFYLPQFHPIPENDKNWGEGFTEWTNVVKAMPRFPGHYQPKLPSKFGFYDLRLPSIMVDQANLAKQHGISGFCFYYYRFGAKRVLDLPVNNYLKTPDASLPFCYCWANEPWTRAWDGKTSDMLFSQTYGDDTFNGLVNDLLIAIADKRYIYVNSKPLILIYQVAELPNPAEWVARMRAAIREKAGREIMIGSVFSPNFQAKMLEFLDFVVQFPPHRIPRSGPRIVMDRRDMEVFDSTLEDYYESYDEVVKAALSGNALMSKMFLGVCPDWDNAARRKNKATTLVGSSPAKFAAWVKEAAKLTRDNFSQKRIAAPLIFVNAWNEWAEGAMLEPTERYGYAYLDAIRDSLKA